jgi:hypothetical protein
MVRAILAGTKTQTRRIVKEYAPGLVRVRRNHDRGCLAYITDRGIEWSPAGGSPKEPYPHALDCAPYAVGDLLWVKETFAQYPVELNPEPCDWWYRATRDVLPPRVTKWKPSIYMPREASRITLRVTGVRVERLQAITEADAMAEGCERPVLADQSEALGFRVHPMTGNYVDAYRALWGSINGAGSWDANPWVWVYEFERVTT